MEFQRLVNDQISQLIVAQHEYYNELKELLENDGFYNPIFYVETTSLEFKSFQEVLTVLIEVKLTKITINYKLGQYMNDVCTAEFEAMLTDLPVSDVYDLLKSTVTKFIVNGELDEKQLVKPNYDNELINLLAPKQFKKDRNNWLNYTETINNCNIKLGIKFYDHGMNVFYMITKENGESDYMCKWFYKKLNTPKKLSEILITDLNNLKNTLDFKSVNPIGDSVN